jgi:biofilm PGA synthesis lipoprotein PgaB
VLRLLLFLALLVSTAAHAVGSHAVVFMYHRFGDSRYPSTNIDTVQFARQLDYLDANGYRIWPLARIVDHLESGLPIPDRTVALTVDDAYRSVYENAFPLIRERKVPVTVFVATDAVERAPGELMSWEQMRRMQATGLVDFANHSASHDHLAFRRSGESRKQWNQRVTQDLLRAADRLEQELGPGANTAKRLFAYPYGEYSAPLAELVQGLGYTAFGQHSGAIGPLSDRRALPRYPISEAFADPNEFARKAASLPLPVSAQHPWDPIASRNPPRLEFTVKPGGANLSALACYVSGQGRTAVERVGERTFSIQANKPLHEGRSRYNCTAPDTRENRYYWFSQPWLIGRPAEDVNPDSSPPGRHGHQ